MLAKGSYICTSCRVQLDEVNNCPITSNTQPIVVQNDSEVIFQENEIADTKMDKEEIEGVSKNVKEDKNIENMNQILFLLEVSPISKKEIFVPIYRVRGKLIKLKRH